MADYLKFWTTLNQDVELKSPTFIKKRLFDSISAMVKAGIDVVAALETLSEDRQSDYERRLIDHIIDDLKEGLPIWKVFENYDLIPPQLLTLIRIGEESGTLPENMSAAQAQMSKNRKFKGQLKSASVYPAFILILLLVVGAVITVFVLPRLTQVYSSLGSDLPLVTRIMIWVGDFMGQYGLIFLPIFIGSISVIGYLLFLNKSTKHFGDTLVFNTPFIHKILVEVQIARLGQMMENLLGAGIAIDDALMLLSETTEIREYAAFYKEMRLLIMEGTTIHDSFREIKNTDKLVPLIAQQLISSGEQTGELVDAFTKIGEEFEAKTEASAKDFGTLFEPVLIIFVWIGVALVAFAVIIPLYSVVGSFNDIAAPSGTVKQSYPPQVIDFADPAKQELNSGSSLDIFFNLDSKVGGSVPDSFPSEPQVEEVE